MANQIEEIHDQVLSYYSICNQSITFLQIPLNAQTANQVEKIHNKVEDIHNQLQVN